MVAAIIGSILWLLILTVGATGLIIWQGLVPIVVCMEEDKRDRTALGRAYELLRGHWWRMITMLTIIGLAGLVLYTILLATMGSLTGLFNGFSRIGDLLSGRESPERFMESLGAFMGILLLPQILLGTLWNPVHHLILTLFYLDIRVRKEALDLEWTAYASASPTQSLQGESTPAAAPTPAYIAPVEVSSFAARPVPAPELCRYRDGWAWRYQRGFDRLPPRLMMSAEPRKAAPRQPALQQTAPAPERDALRRRRLRPARCKPA